MTPDDTRTVPRGRHRKPRHRRALLAAGALTLTAGAATLIHLATPDAPPRDTRAAAPLPDTGTPTPSASATPTTGETPPPPTPHPSPTSPRAQGGKAQAPLIPSEEETPPRSTPRPVAGTHTRTTAPQPSETPQPQHPTTPLPPTTTPPAPPADENENDDRDRGLCLPLLNICLGG